MTSYPARLQRALLLLVTFATISSRAHGRSLLQGEGFASSSFLSTRRVRRPPQPAATTPSRRRDSHQSSRPPPRPAAPSTCCALVDATATGGTMTCGATGLVLTVNPTNFAAIAATITVTGKAGNTATMNPAALAGQTCSSRYGAATWGSVGGATTLDVAAGTDVSCSAGTEGSCLPADSGSVTPLTPHGKLAVAPRHSCTIRASDGAVLCSGENQVGAGGPWRERLQGPAAAEAKPRRKAARPPFPPTVRKLRPLVRPAVPAAFDCSACAPPPASWPCFPLPFSRNPRQHAPLPTPSSTLPPKHQQWGQIGIGTTVNTTGLYAALEPVSGSGILTGATWVATGGYYTNAALSGHTCACLGTGEAVCWGQNLGQARLFGLLVLGEGRLGEGQCRPGWRPLTGRF
jgi:hypothetical protein